MFRNSADELKAALGNALPVEYFLRVAVTSLRKTPLLAQCTVPSLMSGLLDVASLQLTLNGITGEAWMVPFRNKDGNYEATLIIGYKGYVKLMRRSQEVLNLHADVVHKEDKFVLKRGSECVLLHEPNLEVRSSGPENWIGAYAIIFYKNGGSDFEFVTKAKIEKIRKSSRAGDRGPWVDWPDAMWKKTAIRQLKNFVSLEAKIEQMLD